MAKGMLRGVLAGLGVAALGLVAVSAVAPRVQRPEDGLAARPAVAAAVAPGPTVTRIAAADPVRAPRPAAPLPQPAVFSLPEVAAADPAPVLPRALPPQAQAAPVALAALAVRPTVVAPLPARRAMADPLPVAAPVVRTSVPVAVAVPRILPADLAEPSPQAPRTAPPPIAAAQPEPAARPLAMATPAAPPAASAARPGGEVLSRSEANPALVLQGADADTAPAPAKPVVRRPGDAQVAQADSDSGVLKKPAPLAPAPGLKTEGGPETAGTLPVKAAAAAPAAPADAPPRVAFARPFDNPSQKPLLAIVLFDTGDPALDRTALAAMPVPVTFVLDPAKPESALAASIYRSGGQEVAMLATAIPMGATASDVEVTFAAHATVMPEAVAVVVPETDGFQDNRPVATLVVPVVAGQGRGLLSWDRGLNAADQVARREGAHAATIFRRLDGKGEDATRIRQYLDRAAFKAAQEGRVVVAGETRPETVQALLAWAVEGRASSVALAPLTAALQAQ